MGIGVAARDDEDNEERVEDDEVSAHRRIIPTAWFMGLTLIPLQLRIMYIMSSCVLQRLMALGVFPHKTPAASLQKLGHAAHSHAMNWALPQCIADQLELA